MDQVGWQMRLDRQAFTQEFLVEIFPSLLAHQDASAAFVDGGTACTTHHLKQIGDRVINVTMFLPFEILNAHDDDHVGGDRQTPRSFLRTIVCTLVN